MTAPLASSTDVDALIAAAAAEQLPIDLSTVVAHTHGWENAVLETADGWILRFPRNERIAFDRELAVLRRLAGRLPAAIPAVAFTGIRTRFAAYRKLVGSTFDRRAYLAAGSAERDALAASLAGFLAALHVALSSAEIVELGLPLVDHRAMLDLVVSRADQVPAEHRRAVHEILTEFAEFWTGGKVRGPTVVLHNDFHADNMVFAGPVGEVTGVWDFTCVQLGAPSFDLRYFDTEPRDLLERLADQYHRRTGHRPDVSAAVAANRMENIYDALDTGRLELLDAAAARWRMADAGD